MPKILETYKDVQVAVVGMGRSNQALCRYLLKEGALVTCFDRKTREKLGDTYEAFNEQGVKWSLGPEYLDILPGYKHIFLTPGMKKDHPKISQARKEGAVISTEIDLFLNRCKGVVGAVTGSAGKTTTCMLTGLMLEKSLPGTKVFVGGNIGSVLIEKAGEIPEDARVVLELSSFQLQLCRQSPHSALLLNVRPNHLDIHKDFDEYVESKKNIFRFQGENDWAFLNYDELPTRSIANECKANVGFYLSRPPVDRQGGRPQRFAWLDGDDLVYDPGNGAEPIVVAGKNDLLIPGDHNISNVLGAVLLSMQLGANLLGIKNALKSFRGIEHRIEFVREINGVKYYNDSIATSPDRTIALIDSVKGPLVLILGGYDKGLPFDELAAKLVQHRCKAVLLGACGGKIQHSIESAWARAGLSGAPEIAKTSSLEEAVNVATAMVSPGSSVALSPACASYDMFSSFEERGQRFKDIVLSINGE